MRLRLRRHTLAGLAFIAIALAACQTRAPVEPTPQLQAQPVWTDAWHAFGLPGKRATQYDTVHVDGRWALRARADRSASLYRRKLHLPCQCAMMPYSELIKAE
jgi:hypothetical protein